ncbi:MAG: DsbA family protein [Rhodospirillales bacterium]|nr:DsbA family protein [Rhodospirillales bacterium]
MRQTLLGIVAILTIALAGGKTLAADYDEVLGEKVLGRMDAPVTIYEHSSLTCGHCGDFHRDTLPELKKEYIDTGKVRFIYRDFPLGRLAMAAAMIPHCAPPERYFGFLDALFLSQGTWARSDDPAGEMSRVARLGGMSAEKFNECLGNQQIFEAIRDRAAADQEEHGINSTPTFIINGEKVAGNLPIEDFKDIIEEALKEAN